MDDATRDRGRNVRGLYDHLAMSHKRHERHRAGVESGGTGDRGIDACGIGARGEDAECGGLLAPAGEWLARPGDAGGEWLKERGEGLGAAARRAPPLAPPPAP